MFEFGKAQNRRADLRNANLRGGNKLVIAMRWFAYQAAWLHALNVYSNVLATEKHRSPRRVRISHNAEFMATRTNWQALMVSLRAALEANPREALGAGALAVLLEPGAARDHLCEYLDAHDHPGKMTDRALREQYLDYIQKYAAILASGTQLPIAADAHPLVEKASLVRRAATKAVTHSTVDDYHLTGSDLQDVTHAVVVVGFAIQSVMGLAAVDSDFAAIERASLDGANSLLGIQEKDLEPHLSNAIAGFLPAWVATGKEFPNMAELAADRMRPDDGNGR